MANTHNFVHPDGRIEGLHVLPGETMRIWDFDPTLKLGNADSPIGDMPILVEDGMTIASDGVLRVVLEDNTWGSTLTFEPGIDILLDGVLELFIDPNASTNLTSLIGTTFDLFDWDGVEPTGAFSAIATEDGFDWDVANLYTTGDVTLTSVPESLLGDYNDDGVVDGTDFLAWQRGESPTPDSEEDLLAWERNFGSVFQLQTTSAVVPEPSTGLLLFLSNSRPVAAPQDRVDNRDHCPLRLRFAPSVALATFPTGG